MGVLTAVGRRLLQVLLTVVIVALLIFALMRLLPGDPALVMLGDRATDARIVELHHQLGLDEPVIAQFWHFLLRTITLQLGDSITLRVPVSRLVATGLPITLMLTAMGRGDGAAPCGAAGLHRRAAPERMGRRGHPRRRSGQPIDAGVLHRPGCC